MIRRLLGHDVVCRATGAGPVEVVLVHGIGVSGRYFSHLARELSPFARVLVPDLPGFGDSPRPAVPLSIAEHAAVVAALMAEARLDRPVLVGHSMGTQVVTEVALAHPGLVGGVVLVGPVVDPRARSGVRQGFRLMRDVVHEAPWATALQIREWLRCGPRWYAATLPAMLEHPMEDRVGGLRVPTVFARGARDPVTPRDYLDGLAARVPGATTLEVPRSGHLAMYCRPEHVAAAALGLRA